MEEPDLVARRIKTARLSKNLSICDVAKGVGLGARLIEEIELGILEGRLVEVIAVALHLKADLRFLLSEKERMLADVVFALAQCPGANDD